MQNREVDLRKRCSSLFWVFSVHIFVKVLMYDAKHMLLNISVKVEMIYFQGGGEGWMSVLSKLLFVSFLKMDLLTLSLP